VQSLAETNELLHEAGSRNVGITLDSYHWYGSHGTLDQIRETPGHWISLLHINDGKADVDRDHLHDFDRVMPGHGNFPLAPWLQAISSTGFDGFVALEVLGPAMEGVAPAAYAEAGIQALTAVYAQAGLSLR
jgi:sugar phosphate isomerase/epimerase